MEINNPSVKCKLDGPIRRQLCDHLYCLQIANVLQIIVVNIITIIILLLKVIIIIIIVESG
jgi:hypothetical protein